jgi:hypothetical protein
MGLTAVHNALQQGYTILPKAAQAAAALQQGFVAQPRVTRVAATMRHLSIAAALVDYPNWRRMSAAQI